MLVLILASLLFPVCSSQVDTGSSGLIKKCHLQHSNFCIWLKEGDIEAEAGLCVVIPCSFTIPAYQALNIIWSKCKKSDDNCVDSDRIFNTHNDPSKVVKSGFKGRVSLLEPDVSRQNCSIIINDLRESDSGFYQFRVEGTHRFSFTEKRASLSVKGLTQKPTVKVPPLTEGQETTLNCTAPGLCSGSAPEITWMWKKGKNKSPITRDSKAVNLSAPQKRNSQTFTFTPSAEHHGTKISCEVRFTNGISTEKTEILNVTYLKDPVIDPVITGNRSVKLGDALNLTCSVDSFPPSVVTWTKHGSKQTMQTDMSTVRLHICHMTAGDVGKYICTASQQITKRTARSEVNVTMKTRILNSSKCELQSQVLTCVCISQGFPLPTIEWPQLKNQTHHSLSTSASENTVNVVTASVKDLNYTTVQCVSRNEIEEVKMDLRVVIKNATQDVINNDSSEKAPPGNLFENIKKAEVIVAFLIGLLLSAVVCCSVQNCHRKKQKSSQNVSTENLEMMDVDPAHGQDQAEGGAEPGEVEYSNINLDLLKRGRPIGAERSQETSEYAEIKKNKAPRTQDNDGEDGEDGEVMEGNQEEVMVEERRDNVVEKEEEEEEEEEALYSNVKDLMKKV